MEIRMKLKSRGRGKNYTLRRGVLEQVITVLYARNWPRRLREKLPFSYKIKRINHTRLLPEATGGQCRCIFLSDIHIGPTTPFALLDQVFSSIRMVNPDVLLLGGDYVFLEPSIADLDYLTAGIASIKCKTKLAVMGNHDLWADDIRIFKALKDAGVGVLINQQVRLPSPWNNIVVIGLDDPLAGNCEATAAFNQHTDKDFKIVLCHSPDGLLNVADCHFDLYLCGHTHGGHLAAPWGPVILPQGTLCRRFPAGLKQFNSGEVFTSRGIGGVESPVRTFAAPDILVVDLVRS